MTEPMRERIRDLESQLAEATVKLEAAEAKLAEWAEKDGNSPGYNIEKAKTYGRIAHETKQKLEAAERDAGRMHYLGNMVRSRSSDEQAELNALMRKYPARPEPEGVAAPVEGEPACEHCNADPDEPCDRGVDHSGAAPVEQPQLPGGLGPVDALRAEIVAALRKANDESGYGAKLLARVADELEKKP